MRPFTKYFDDYRDLDAWLHPRQFKAPVCKEMFPSGWTVTLEGEDAKRALDEYEPIEPGGFRLREIERFG